MMLETDPKAARFRQIGAAVFIIFMLLSFSGLSTDVNAKEKRKKKLSAKRIFLESEIGGYVGALTIGAGYRFFNAWDTSLIYGFVPSGLGGEDLQQLIWKNTLRPPPFRFFKIIRCSIYVGLSIIYCFDSELFVDQPRRYPRDYYPPNAYNFAPFVGFSLRHKNFEYYCEITGLNEDIKSWVDDSSAIDYSDVFKVGIGVKWFCF